MNILDRGWWEQPHIDLWTIPHVLAGVIGSAVAIMFGVGMVAGGIWGMLLAIGWEALEHALGISKVEKISNIVADVVVMLFGYAAGFWMFVQLRGTPAFGVVFAAACTVFVAANVLGVIAYQRYRKKQR